MHFIYRKQSTLVKYDFKRIVSSRGSHNIEKIGMAYNSRKQYFYGKLDSVDRQWPLVTHNFMYVTEDSQ